MLEWILWRLPVKAMFEQTDGLRERVVKSRPADPRPPRSLTRRYQVAEATHEGRRVFTLSPRGRTAKMHLLYLHGGAYAYEITGLQWKMLGSLLDKADITVTVPLYPLAPESACEQVLRFVLGVYDSVLDGSGGRPVVFLGDSSGGGLALSLSQQLRDGGKALPKSLVLLSPWLDVTCPEPVQQELDKADPITRTARTQRGGGVVRGCPITKRPARQSSLWGPGGSPADLGPDWYA